MRFPSDVTRQAESAAASAPKTRPQPPPRTLEYDVYHYHAEGQARVRVTLDGKRWPEITVPWTYDDKSTRIAYSAATLESYARQAALNTAKAEVDGRWHQHVAERLGEHLAAIRDEEARSREGSLGWYYLDDTSPRRFLEHSIDALRASGVVVECWLRDSGCFSAPPPAR